MNGRDSVLKLPKTLHRLWVDKREVELWRNIVRIDLIKGPTIQLLRGAGGGGGG